MSQTATRPAATRGTLIEQNQGAIVLGLPDTDYQIHLLVDATVDADAGQPIAGVIHTRAKRVDIVRTGGRFIEPVYGRPRRLQGVVVATDLIENTITVECGGCPFVGKLTTDQKAAAFPQGALVAFDVERGATFEPLPATRHG